MCVLGQVLWKGREQQCEAFLHANLAVLPHTLPLCCLLRCLLCCLLCVAMCVKQTAASDIASLM